MIVGLLCQWLSNQGIGRYNGANRMTKLREFERMAGTLIAIRQMQASRIVCLAGTFDCHLKKIISENLEKMFYNSKKLFATIEGITMTIRNVL